MYKLNDSQSEEILTNLQTRFSQNMSRHPGLDWSTIKSKLQNNPAKLWSLLEMERTGGEPDVVSYEKKSNEYTFFDCSLESPKNRRSLCYDRAALDSRKSFKPQNSALDLASAMGVEILTEDQYRHLQRLGEFDTKSQSWIKTPAEIRSLGGAIFADRRYNHVFVYHNSAESYYAARGFRTCLRV